MGLTDNKQKKKEIAHRASEWQIFSSHHTGMATRSRNERCRAAAVSGERAAVPVKREIASATGLAMSKLRRLARTR